MRYTYVMINQRVFVSWLPIAIAVTVIFGVTYAAIQQSYRQNANDPQIQMAEDGALLLEQGISVQQLVSQLKKVNISTSLDTFVIFFDSAGDVIANSGYIGTSTIPNVPKGVLQSAKTMDINKVTWQISTGERFAAVIKQYNRKENASSTLSGYILVARSLREIENRAFQLEIIMGIGWIVSMAITLIAEWFKLLYQRRYLMNKGDNII